MTVDDILIHIKYDYDLDRVDMLKFNFYTHLSTREYNCLINEYKRTKEKRIHDFLYANSYMIYRAIYNKRYSSCTYGLKTLNGWNDSDVLQDFIFVFYHALNKYEDIGEASSYSSYINYHYRYFITELIRTKYFQVLRVPQKEARKQETRRYKSELFENSIVNTYAEDDIVDRADRELDKLIKQVKIMIERKHFSELEWEMFLKYNGLLIDDKEYTLLELKEIYKLSDTNKVFYKISKVVECCKKDIYFKKRNALR